MPCSDNGDISQRGDLGRSVLIGRRTITQLANVIGAKAIELNPPATCTTASAGCLELLSYYHDSIMHPMKIYVTIFLAPDSLVNDPQRPISGALSLPDFPWSVSKQCIQRPFFETSPPKNPFAPWSMPIDLLHASQASSSQGGRGGGVPSRLDSYRVYSRCPTGDLLVDRYHLLGIAGGGGWGWGWGQVECNFADGSGNSIRQVHLAEDRAMHTQVTCKYIGIFVHPQKTTAKIDSFGYNSIQLGLLDHGTSIFELHRVKETA